MKMGASVEFPMRSCVKPASAQSEVFSELTLLEDDGLG